MRRITALVTALALAMVWAVAPALSRPADALDVWCWDDPVLEIAGQRVSVNIGVRQSDLSKVVGAAIVVTVPEGVNARVVSTDDHQFPSWVQIVHEGRGNNGNIPVTVVNTLVARGSFDYQVNATTDHGRTMLDQETGALTNRAVTLEFKLRNR
jgi:hypothetical protein